MRKVKHWLAFGMKIPGGICTTHSPPLPPPVRPQMNTGYTIFFKALKIHIVRIVKIPTK